MRTYEHYLVAPSNGAPGNEYRILRDHVQFRIVDEGIPGAWRTLSTGDILMHLTLETCVGKWLTERSQRAARSANAA